ncbi:MAG: hypothetical protein AAF548_11155 [Actinomycetota bacterium]
MRRSTIAAVGLAYLLAIAVALVLPGPVGARQEMAPPRGSQTVAVELDAGRIDEGVIVAAWAIDPVYVLGVESLETAVHVDVAGYDAVVTYGVYPACSFAPRISARTWEDRIRVIVDSFGGCDANSIRVGRAVALELADGVDPALLVATHRDP